jgi:flagellar hook assembly protein FlgD
MVAVFVAVSGVWLAPRVSESYAAWLGSPAVHARTVKVHGAMPVAAVASHPALDRLRGEAMPGAVGAAEASTPEGPTGETLEFDAGLRFTMVGLHCRPPNSRASVTIRLRTSENGVAWSAWYSADLEYAAEVGGSPQAFTEALWTGSGRYIQVAAEAAQGVGSVPAVLNDVRLTAISTAEDSDPVAQGLGVVRRVAMTIASLEFAAPSQAMTTQPTIVRRAQWGANESWRTGEPSVAPVKMAFIHHTGSGNSYTRAEAPAIVRGAYYYHTKSLGWSDIGYNFLIDRYGTVYEGRYGGISQGVIGAQTLGYNTGSTGISVIGEYTHAAPPAAAVNALKRLLAWKLDLHHVDPASRVKIVCSYGSRYATGQVVDLPAIAGHRDANFTDCPGNKLYALLPSIRRAAASQGLPKIYAPSVSVQFLSPNRDGNNDKSSLSFRISSSADWHIDVRDGAGASVRTFDGSGLVARAEWDGRSAAGVAQPDGAYTVVMSAETASGVARQATATVVLDTMRPKLGSVAISPDPFSPNGDGQRDETTVSFTPNEVCSSKVSVLGSGGAVLRRLSAWSMPTARRTAVRWKGDVGAGNALSPAAEGPTVIEIALRDRAGNTAVFTRGVLLDRTLGFPSVAPGTFSPDGDGVQDVVTLGYKLTRKATVTVEACVGVTVLHTLDPGELGAGAHTLKWDGNLASETPVASGFYQFRVKASSAMGASVVSVPFTVDRYRPRISAPERASATYGRAARISYTVRDPYSPKVKVWAVVKGAQGATVATVACGWVAQGKAQSCVWSAPGRGVYTVAFNAVDRGGNRQSAVPTTVLTVR